MKIAVFSGRFDPPHLGHLITMVKLSNDHDIVIVPVLSYDDRLVDAATAIETMKRVTKALNNNKVRFSINIVHFAKISAGDYGRLLRREGVDQSINEVIYYSGNHEVLNHMNDIGVKNKFIERSFDEYYSSTIIKNGIKHGT